MNDAVLYLSTLGPLQITGCVGFLVYIWVFASVQFGWMDGNSVIYALGNILAASLVGLSLFAEFNLSSALIQSSWVAIGVIGVLRRLSPRRSKRSAQSPLYQEVR